MGIEVDGEEAGQDGLADHLLEGLAFGFTLLAMAFDAMTEDLVEEHGSSAAREDCGAGIRINDGRGA